MRDVATYRIQHLIVNVHLVLFILSPVTAYLRRMSEMSMEFYKNPECSC